MDMLITKCDQQLDTLVTLVLDKWQACKFKSYMEILVRSDPDK